MTHGGTVTPGRNRKGGHGNPPPTGARTRFLSRHPHERFEVAGAGNGPGVFGTAPALDPTAASAPGATREPTMNVTYQQGTVPTLGARHGQPTCAPNCPPRTTTCRLLGPPCTVGIAMTVPGHLNGRSSRRLSPGGRRSGAASHRRPIRARVPLDPPDTAAAESALGRLASCLRSEP